MQTRTPRISALTKRRPPQLRRDGAKGGLVYWVQDAAVFEGAEDGAESLTVVANDVSVFEGAEAGAERLTVVATDSGAVATGRYGADTVAIGAAAVPVQDASARYIGRAGAATVGLGIVDAASAPRPPQGAERPAVGVTDSAARVVALSGAERPAIGIQAAASVASKRLGSELVAIGASAVSVVGAAVRYVGRIGAAIVQGITPFPGVGTGHVWRLSRRGVMSEFVPTTRDAAMATRDTYDEFEPRERAELASVRMRENELPDRLRVARLGRHAHQDTLVIPAHRVKATKRAESQALTPTTYKTGAARRSPKGILQ